MVSYREEVFALISARIVTVFPVHAIVIASNPSCVSLRPFPSSFTCSCFGSEYVGSGVSLLLARAPAAAVSMWGAGRL